MVEKRHAQAYISPPTDWISKGPWLFKQVSDVVAAQLLLECRVMPPLANTAHMYAYVRRLRCHYCIQGAWVKLVPVTHWHCIISLPRILMAHSGPWMLHSRQFLVLTRTFTSTWSDKPLPVRACVRAHVRACVGALVCVCVSMNLSQPGSQGEPWPDADPWNGQESQLSVVSTQGVDPLA